MKKTLKYIQTAHHKAAVMYLPCLSLLLALVFLFSLSGCVNHSTTTPTLQNNPTPPLSTPVSVAPPPSTTLSSKATAIMAPIITAMRQILTVNIDSNIVNQYTIRRQSNNISSVYIWDGQKFIDFGNNQMHLTMDIDVFGVGGYLSGIKINTYYSKAISYEQAWTSATSNGDGRWGKAELADGMLTAADQLAPVLELLQNADQSIIQSFKKIDGQNYQIITFHPSPEAVADWLLSLEYAPGPSLSVSTGPSIVGKNAYIEAYQGGIFQIWVNSLNNLIVKAYFAPYFQATLNDLNSTRTSVHESFFTAQLDFSAYNQPVDVQVPPEALAAAGNGN